MNGIENALPVNADAIKKSKTLRGQPRQKLEELRGAIGNPKECSPLTDSYLPHATGRALDTPKTVQGCSTLPNNRHSKKGKQRWEIIIGHRTQCNPGPRPSEPHHTALCAIPKLVFGSIPAQHPDASKQSVSGHGEQYRGSRRAQKGVVSYNIWLHPLIEHATKEGQAISTQFWSIGSNKGLLAIARITVHDSTIGDERADVGARTTGEKQGPRKAQRGNWKNKQNAPKQQKLALWYYSSSDHRDVKSLQPRVPTANTIESQGHSPSASEFLHVPFPLATLASRAITFEGSLTNPTLPREEVVTVREPYNRAQPPFHPFSLYWVSSFLAELSLIISDSYYRIICAYNEKWLKSRGMRSAWTQEDHGVSRPNLAW
ncbi:hypothetical protein CRG98_014647 [Punica granatum]|uniref:Uncharacterized protein n=1 Tax=Punica granatum TaxID=22663 RepID=A0A2I0KA08_PUNGR|nr:hypothetical protein CRG98_014647 [Punica granatum]